MPDLHRFRLVIALDRSEYAEIVLEHALDQAAHHTALDLHFLAVVDTRDDIDAAKAQLADLVLPALDDWHTPDWHARLHVRVGRAADEIVDLVGEVDADLLVIGRFGASAPHGRGSIAETVIARVACPALVVGLSGHAVDAQPQCPECVAVRAESEGERWFCAAHVSPDRLDLTARLPSSSMPVMGGPMF